MRKKVQGLVKQTIPTSDIKANVICSIPYEINIQDKIILGYTNIMWHKPNGPNQNIDSNYLCVLIVP